jgi:hypothetical protein
MRSSKPRRSSDLLEIAGLIGPIIDKLVMDLFTRYSRQLLTEPVTYIVPAVWGATKDGLLDETQTEMFGHIAPTIARIQALLDLDDLRDSQSFAIGFLIRGIIISKVAYLVESFRYRMENGLKVNAHQDEFMMKVKPWGTA